MVGIEAFKEKFQGRNFNAVMRRRRDAGVEVEVEAEVEVEVEVKVERSGICVVNKNKREMVLQSIPI